MSNAKSFELENDLNNSLFLSNAIDSITTYIGVSKDIAVEKNPLINTSDMGLIALSAKQIQSRRKNKKRKFKKI